MAINDISDLTFDPKNARKRTEASGKMLADSLKEFGAARSIVIDEDGLILAGNGTIAAANNAGIRKVRVIKADGDEIIAVQRSGLTPEQKVRLAIADNRTAELAEWDDEILLELGEEYDLDDYFNEDDLAEFTQPSEASEPVEEDDEAVSDLIESAEKEEIESRVKPGQIWALGRHRIACGDSTDEGNIKKLLGDKFGGVGMVWADPPFGIDLKPQRGLTKAIANDRQWEAKDVWAAFIPTLFELMRENTTAFLCQGWTEFDWTLPIVRKHFTIKNKIVWYKNQIGIGYYLRPQHEDILYCWKGQPEKPAIAISNVWQMARLNAPEHSCEKPTDLPLKAMEFASLPSDLIYDPFLGVAPSIIAAQKMEGNRTVYGFELSEAYCEVICRRYEQFTGETAELVGHL